MYLCDDDSMVDLVKDVHGDLVLPTNLQHPVVARGNSKSYTRKKIQSMILYASIEYINRCVESTIASVLPK